MKLETQAIHAGYESEATTKAVAVPIYQTVAYEFDDAQHGADLFNLAVPGNIYTRIMNPTNDVLEQRVAAMEGGVASLALASGQAAITYSILNLAEAGNNIVTVPQLYGGTWTLFRHMLPKLGIDVRFAEGDSPDDLAKLIDDKTSGVFLESIGNPAGNIPDMAAIADMAHAHGVPVIVDNTVPTPALCRPVEHGCDIVLHSMTKYMGGHGNSIAGILVDGGIFDWTKHARALLHVQHAGTELSRRCLHRRHGTGRLYRARPRRRPAQHRFRAKPLQRLPCDSRLANPVAAHGAACGQRADGRQTPGKP